MSKAGFFPGASLTVLRDDKPGREPKCGACGLWKTCKSPKMKPSGKGRKKILILAEAPGRDEDERGTQLVGVSGRELQNTLSRVGIDMRRDCVLHNALACRPPNNKIPEGGKSVEYCRPNLVNLVNEMKPEVIIPLGGTAVESLLGWLWKDSVDGIGRWAGYRIPSQQLNAWICPTYHPAALLHDERNLVLKRMFAAHLAGAAEKAGKGRPWKEVPDYQSQVRVVTDPTEAAKLIRTLPKPGEAVAFDYETTTLKPDGKHAQIHTCALSNGRWTFAFPWGPGVLEPMRRFLTDKRIGKIASNAKFEDRWTRAKVGVEVAGWHRDTMLTAHAVENADKFRKISSLKFQAFVHLGQPRYDLHVEPYLKSSSNCGDAPNRVKELDLRELLVYNGMDALLEWKVAKVQGRLMKGAS